MKLFSSLYLFPFTAFASLFFLGSCSNRHSDVKTITLSLIGDKPLTDYAKASGFCTKVIPFCTPATGIKAYDKAKDGLKTHSAVK